MNKKSICELINHAYTQFDHKENLSLSLTLEEIRERAAAMEDRLVRYCNAIEDLGFYRDGRDYDQQ